MSEPKFKKVYLDGKLVGEVRAGANREEDMALARALIEQRGLKREVSLYEATFQQAVAFGRAAARIHESDLLHVPRRLGSVPAFIANSAFAIELYLKALGEKHGTPLGRGHKLRKLYEALPPAAHGAIDRAFPTALAERAVEHFSILATLHALNDAFVNWRYSYEHTRLEAPALEHIIVVIQAMHAACREHAT
jgi:hypothetical protein